MSRRARLGWVVVWSAVAVLFALTAFAALLAPSS